MNRGVSPIFLVRRKRREHVLGKIRPLLGTADTDPQPRETGAEGVAQVPEAVVGPGSAGDPNAKGAEGEIHVVHDHQHVLRLHLELPEQPERGGAGSVHVDERTGDDHHAARSDDPKLAREPLHPLLSTPPTQHLGRHLEPDIVAGSGVLRPGVAETENQIDGHDRPVAATRSLLPPRPCPCR